MRSTEEKTEKTKVLKSKKKLSPPLIIMIGFLAIILIGSLLLSLPFATKTKMPYIDLLFTSTSSVCVVGLMVVDVSQNFTYFGQIVILLLIQIGGLGFMTIATLIFIFIGKKITLKERMALSEAYNQDSLQGVVKLTRYIIGFTLIIELAGAILLSFYFIPEMGWLKGIYYSAFHSVSAFCNAGISLVDFSADKLSGNVLVNLSMMSLIIVGGLGFAVIKDIIATKRLRKFTFHTKVVLLTSVVLIISSSFIFALSEWDNYGTMGGNSVFGKIMRSVFQAVTARTAGFNTVTQSSLTDASKLVTVINMFIGASPASTGGGIKTTTVFLLVMIFLSGLKNQEKEIKVFGKSIAIKTAHRAVMYAVYALLTIMLFSLLILIVESSNTAVTLETAVFEAFSAFGTVGLSLGITPLLSPLSRVLIIILMFVGRLGILILGVFLLQQKSKETVVIKHPEAKLIIG